MVSRTLAVVGPTAAGKTALAIGLAQRLGGEIVSADSRQVYRSMDIGTAKPTAAEQKAARHWLIDVAAPGEGFTLATYVDLARAAIDDIHGRGRTAIICGGTGQYVWALLERWEVPRVAPDRELRAHLEGVAATSGVDALIAELRAVDPASAERLDARNVRRVIRAIEVTRATGTPFSDWQRRGHSDEATPVIGLSMPREALYNRIDQRVDAMFAAGFVDEVRHLIQQGCACDLPAMSGIGYRQVCEHLQRAVPLADAVARVKTESHRLARMQRAWFREDDPRIHWIDATAADTLEQACAVAQSS